MVLTPSFRRGGRPRPPVYVNRHGASGRPPPANKTPFSQTPKLSGKPGQLRLARYGSRCRRLFPSNAKPGEAGLRLGGRRNPRIWSFPGIYANRGSGMQRISSDDGAPSVGPGASGDREHRRQPRDSRKLSALCLLLAWYGKTLSLRTSDRCHWCGNPFLPVGTGGRGYPLAWRGVTEAPRRAAFPPAGAARRELNPPSRGWLIPHDPPCRRVLGCGASESNRRAKGLEGPPRPPGRRMSSEETRAAPPPPGVAKAALCSFLLPLRGKPACAGLCPGS